jgi:hypothetical protein
VKLKPELHELQRLLAQTDLITGSIRSSNSGFVEALLAKRKLLKVKIYQEVGHSMPYVYVDYGRRHHVASYRSERFHCPIKRRGQSLSALPM